jgi:hypothetical protein
MHALHRVSVAAAVGVGVILFAVADASFGRVFDALARAARRSRSPGRRDWDADERRLPLARGARAE